MFWNLDVLGLDVLGLDVLILDVLGYHRYSQGEKLASYTLFFYNLAHQLLIFREQQ